MSETTRQNPPETPHELFNEEVLSKIIDAVSRGNFWEPASKAARVPHTVFWRWVRWGRSGFEPYAAFVERLELAEAEAELFHVDNLRSQAIGDNVHVLTDKNGNETGVRAIGDWRCSMAWLGRKSPARWSEAIRIKEGHRELEEERRPKTDIALEAVISLLHDAGYDVTKRSDPDGDGS